MDILLEKGILRNTHKGYVDRKGHHVGHYKTVNKQYIEDYFSNLANKLSRGV